MSHYHSPSRLSRRDLYAYGFKEGQPWGEDRRALESALKAMDELERDIQQNYLQPSYNVNRGTIPSAHGSAYPWVPTSPQYHTPPFFLPVPDVRITRSNENTPSDDGRESDIGWNSASRGSREFDPVSNDFMGMHSRSHSEGERYLRVDGVPAHYRRSSQGHPYATASMTSRPYASRSHCWPSSPPLAASNSWSCHERSRGIENSPPVQIDEEYHSPRSHSRSIPQYGQSNVGPPQMQGVRYDDGHRPVPHYEDDSDDESSSDQYSREAPPSRPLSTALWPANMTRGASGTRTAEADLYPGSYMRTSSSGYVESFGLGSREEDFLNYRDHHRDDIDEECEDFMSDGVASDEGVYYSSGPEEGYGVDDEYEAYSDEGYSSPPEDYYDDD